MTCHIHRCNERINVELSKYWQVSWDHFSYNGPGNFTPVDMIGERLCHPRLGNIRIN